MKHRNLNWISYGEVKKVSIIYKIGKIPSGDPRFIVKTTTKSQVGQIFYNLKYLWLFLDPAVF